MTFINNVISRINNLFKPKDIEINNNALELTNSVIFINIYKIEKKLNEKQGSSTYIISKLKTNTKYFMKVRQYDTNEDINEQYEIYKILSKNEHPNIIHLNDLQHIDKICFMICEYIPNITLMMYHQQNKMKTRTIYALFKQILSGLAYLHENDILHCDLKLENILIYKHQAKIIDFDMSKKCSKDGVYVSDKIFGSINYIAPESYDLGLYSKKSDVWSFGIIMFILVTNKYPYGEKLSVINSYSNLYRRNEFKHINYDDLKDAINKNNISLDFFEILKSMLAFNEGDRYSCDDIYKKIENHTILSNSI